MSTTYKTLYIWEKVVVTQDTTHSLTAGLPTTLPTYSESFPINSNNFWLDDSTDTSKGDPQVYNNGTEYQIEYKDLAKEFNVVPAITGYFSNIAVNDFVYFNGHKFVVTKSYGSNEFELVLTTDIGTSIWTNDYTTTPIKSYENSNVSTKIKKWFDKLGLENGTVMIKKVPFSQRPKELYFYLPMGSQVNKIDTQNPYWIYPSRPMTHDEMGNTITSPGELCPGIYNNSNNYNIGYKEVLNKKSIIVILRIKFKNSIDIPSYAYHPLTFEINNYKFIEHHVWTDHMDLILSDSDFGTSIWTKNYLSNSYNNYLNSEIKQIINKKYSTFIEQCDNDSCYCEEDDGIYESRLCNSDEDCYIVVTSTTDCGSSLYCSCDWSCDEDE